ncbi:protein DBF4 homolog B [Aythya fuligula]|uniref:Protein DBF4 homolog B n=1 Tax=Aythya fuligula TaxID=219594 RepID=A0A6J3E984_AYTFU|nr:protein DBF4 homolog B [Aythya fuligula]
MAGPAATGRPLRGKSFYLDVPSGRAARDLAAAIRHLGGVTESFLSKEVNYVVSSNKEAKRDKAGTRTEKRSNTTSEDAKAKSPMPSTSKGNHTRLQQKPPDKVRATKVYATPNLIIHIYTNVLYGPDQQGKGAAAEGHEESAVPCQTSLFEQDTCSGSSILANARLWGVQILHVDEMLLYAQQLLRAISGSRKQSQKTEVKCLASGSKICKAGKLKPPFLKVEDQSRQFRPFHHQFKSFPDLNFLAPKSSSPFEPLKNLSNSCRARGVEGCPMHSNGEKSPQSTPVTVPKKKRGFCECCRETFEELQKHLQSPQHKQFALDDSRYAPVDRVISQLTNDFVEQPAKVPLCCLTDEHLMPRAQVTGGIEKLTAELGKESQQAEQGAVDLFDAEPDPGLKIKECSSGLPRDRVSNPREEGRLSENCSLGLSVRAGLTAGVCTARATTEEFAVVGDTDSDLAPEFAWGTCVAASHVGEAIASSSEPDNQQVLGSVSHLPQALPVSRKRQLSSSQSTQADDNFRKSSSESDWDVQLLSTLTGVQDSRIRAVDRDLLQRTHVNVRDSGYESQLCSVLKQNSDFEWATKGDKSCRNYCTETKEAPLPIFETFFGSWTS